jgi:imidazolonepropionase-like amidohydrolase
VTSVYVQPSEAGILGGRGALIKVGPGESVTALTIRPELAVQSALGVNPPAGNALQRYGQYESLKRSMERVKKYKEDWEKYREDLKKYEEAKRKYDETAKAKGGDASKKEEAKEAPKEAPKTEEGASPRPGGRFGRGNFPPGARPGGFPGQRPGGGPPEQPKEESKDQSKDSEKKDEEKKAEEDANKPPVAPKEPDKDPVREFLTKLIAREIPLRLEAHRPEDLRNALSLADEFKLRLILEGVSLPGSAIGVLNDRRVPMILGPILEEGDEPAYRQNRAKDWLPSLATDGRKWAIGTFGKTPADSGRLREHAALAVAAGVPEDLVLAAITREAADLLGVGETLGTLAEGKRADLAIFAGDPLDPSAPVRILISGGEVVFEDESAKPRESGKLVSVEPAAAPLPSSYLVKTSRLLTSEGQVAPGMFRVADGKIADRAEALEPKEGETVVDLGEAIVTPGLVLLGVEAAATSSAEPEALEIRAIDSLDPDSPRLRRLKEGGVLTVGLTPAGGNVLGGLVGAIRPGAAEPVASPGIGARLGLDGQSRDTQRFPVSLDGQVSLVEAALSEQLPTSRLFIPQAAVRRLAEVRGEVVSGLKGKKLVAFVDVREGPEIDAALELAAKHGLKVALVGPVEVGRRIERLKESGAALVLTRTSPVAEPRLFEQAAKASASGIPITFAAPDAAAVRSLAARAVAAGLPREKVLAGLTSAAASVAGMPDGLGSIAPGSPADFVVWTGSPIDLRAVPKIIVVDGQIVEVGR